MLMDVESSEDFIDGAQLPVSGDERVYLVPYKWWKEAQSSFVVGNVDENSRGVLYTASSNSSYGAMKIINNIFNPDLTFNLRREEESGLTDLAEVGVSGRDYALVPGELWLQALKWHSDSNLAAKDAGNFSVAEDDMTDVFPLQLRLSVMRETNSLSVKISKKDNAVEPYKRACKIFNVEYEHLRMWDFSGQTTLFFMTDRNQFPKDCQRQSDQEIQLELQVYGLSDPTKCREGKKDELAAQQSKMSLLSNGSTGNTNTSFFLRGSSALGGSSGGAGSLGLTGLQNLGNTCFMNSAIQCLAHTPKLVDYILGDYSEEINTENPLGMDGELALAFGDLLRKLWAPGAAPVAPRLFKSKLSHFAPQFSGFNQHDSQELLAFLLDGLHEDLNRVKCKPYAEAKDSEGRRDDEVADEYWRNHLARNDSIIVDICQGQYKSTLVCPVCDKVSVTFDPFMYLSLPLPSTMMRAMTVTVLSTDGVTLPSPFTINVPKYGKCKDLTQALSIACSLRSDEALLVTEIYNNRIIRYLEDPSDSLSLIRDDDRLAAYRLPKDHEKLPLVVFMHERLDEQYNYGKVASSWKTFGIPLVARLYNIVNGSDIRDLFLKLLNPFIRSAEVAIDDHDNNGDTVLAEVTEMEDAISPPALVGNRSVDESADNQCSELEFDFYLTDDKGIMVKDSKIEINEPISLTGSSKRLNLLVHWQDKMIEQYDTSSLSSLPEIFKSGFFSKRPQESVESVSLYSCLEAFLKDEPLGPEDMWYCPGCKKHRQASKKLDLWRLPEILIIHLKRFQYSRFMKNKLETFVNFPIHDLDLSNYIAYKNGQSSYRYILYAISNHYGSMGGGHYTAFVYMVFRSQTCIESLIVSKNLCWDKTLRAKQYHWPRKSTRSEYPDIHIREHGGNQWFDFDDSHVSPISEEKIKTSAAYVLFYRRVVDA